MPISVVKKIKQNPLWRHWLVFAGLCVLAYAFFAHPDVIETANHGYVLITSTLKGRFLNFYNDVMAHPFGTYLYYINFAHYNIIIYVLFAIVELPYVALHLLFNTALNEPLLYYIGKLVSAGFYIACIPMVNRVALQLGLAEKDAQLAALFFALLPPVFFSSMIMGQYDSICLFFVLLGLYQWLKGNLMLCAVFMGAGAAGKFFSLMVLVPLVLLAEKRPLHIIKYGLVSLWLVGPTSLLFMGRTGDMGMFNNLMMARLFSAKIPAAADLPIFPTLYVILCVAAFFWQPGEKRIKQCGIWLCLAVFCGLFFFVDWHPQWIVLLAPFMVLTTFLEKNRTPWFWVDIMLSAGFFLHCALSHPYQLEANMLDYGVLGLAGLRTVGLESYKSISFYLNLLPVVPALPMVLFGAGLILHTLFKLPLGRGTPATLLAKDIAAPKQTELVFYAWLVFGLGMAVWFFPTIFTWLKCFAIL